MGLLFLLFSRPGDVCAVVAVEQADGPGGIDGYANTKQGGGNSSREVC